MPLDSKQLQSYGDRQVLLGNWVRYSTERSNLGEAKAIISPKDGGPYYYYQKPIIIQFFNWVKGIFTRWDWGTSTAIQDGSSATRIIMERLWPTVSINLIAIVIAVPLGFVFGIIAALNKNKAPDNIISTLVMVMISVPSFVVISILMFLFCFNVNLFPSGWPASTQGVSGATRAAAYMIPVAAICFGTIASFTRNTRAELCEVMSSEFLLLARTKGLTKSQCIVRHALRNSLVPIVPMIIGEFVGILSGSVILEQLYGIPGIGQLFVLSINLKDYNVLFVDMAIYTVIGLFANLLCDLSYGIVDPRIRMGAKAA